MPECTSTGVGASVCPVFFAIGAVRRLRGVAVHCLTHLGIHNSPPQLYYASVTRESGQRDYPLPSCMALLADTPGVHPRSALSLGAGLPESPPRASSVRSSSPILRLEQTVRASGAALLLERARTSGRPVRLGP